MNRLVIGTRGSELAVWQAKAISRLLAEVCDLPIEIRIVKTAGDRLDSIPLSAISGKGFFTKELEDELIAGKIDVAVHSLKDLPIDLPPGLAVGALCCREDPRDVLIALPQAVDDSQILGIKPDAVVGTSSMRRRCQLAALMPSVRIRELRGNVPTRLRKLRDGKFDAIVIASAGVRRLGLDLTDLSVRILDEMEIVPAPAQGILAAEIRSDDDIVRDIVSHIDDANVSAEAALERGLLAMLGGGCSMPLGALATVTNDRLRLRAVLGVPESGSRIIRRTDIEGDNSEEVIRAAHRELTAQA
jgi:hydroxymethylbilane synthase